MPTLAWATDIHLDFATPSRIDALVARLATDGPDGVVLSGDLSNAGALTRHLTLLADRLARPIYFVLGNHDYYGSSIAAVRASMRALTSSSPWLRWLPACAPIDLGDDWILVGHDGWGDARAGDPQHSPVVLNDWLMIAELSRLSRASRITTLRALGDESAAFLSSALPPALARARNVLVVTHVPPFPDACWHEGQISDASWLPWFTNLAFGDVLRATFTSHPTHRGLVLCGHTHSAGTADLLPNLRVLTGAAVYRAPTAQPPLVL